jgi:hypothetical protein
VSHTPVRQRFVAALDALVAEIRQDRSVLAAIICGSLSHDTVWEKSDIDLVLVTIDDRKVATSDLALYADGVNVHAILLPRAEFRRLADGALQHSFMHSFLAKGRLLYTHDPTIADLCASLAVAGERDRRIQLLRAAIGALSPIDKAHKWLLTRGDLDYAALWVLYAATPLAQMEVISAGKLVDREVIPQAMAINPEFFRRIYTDLLNTPKTRAGVEAALDAVDGYMADRSADAFAVIVAHLADVGEARTCREIEDHFKKNFDVSGVTIACEYLADHKRIGKASTAVRLTKKSTVDVQELAFFHLA